jgi:hypothetical protein
VSSLTVHDLDNRGVGKFSATCNRGWFLYGNPGVSYGGQTSVRVPDAVVGARWLQLGRMVYVPHQKLPAYAGMIDTPWQATLPMNLIIHNAEYLFSIRSPERSIKFIEPVPMIVEHMIRLMNEQENLFLSVGEASGGEIHEETLDRRTFLEQLIAMLERTGYEMVLRPERGDGKQLRIYADIGVGLGEDTGFRLHDSLSGANMKVVSASVDGVIINRATGMSGQSTAEAMLETDVLEAPESQGEYRTRSRTLPFRNVTQSSTLERYTQLYLDNAQAPYIDLTVDAYDVGETFFMLRPGNRLLVRSAKVYLPGGVRGWGGTVRVLTMAYDEAANTVKMKLRGAL